MEPQYLHSFVLALLLSLMLIPVLIKVSARLRLMDNPRDSARKLHSDPMPRSGGLGIILGAGIALLIILPIDESLFSFLLGSLVIICFGLLDDIVELKPTQKLTGQALGVALAMSGGMVILEIPFFADAPAWICYALTFVFVMGVINGVNFSDGMDGLAAGTALMALVLIFLFAVESNNTQVATVALAVSASLVGFLRFNTHPATIFMGDAGSQFLGFAIAWLAITVTQSDSSSISTLMPLLILGIPILDILQVVPVRVKKRLPLPGPDKEHFHHQIAKLGFQQHEVVAIIYSLQMLLLGGAYILRFAADGWVFSYYAFFVIATLGSLYVAHSRKWSVRFLEKPSVNERRNPIFRKLSGTHSYSGKFYGVVVSIILAIGAVSSSAMPDSLIYIAVIWALVLLTIRFISKNRWPIFLGRLTTYTATAFSVFGFTLSVQNTEVNALINGLFIGLAIALAISIRTTRKEYFWLTPQDLLLLFFIILIAPQLPLELGRSINVGELIFRTSLLLYACEYVLARGEQARKRLTTTAILALFLLGVNL